MRKLFPCLATMLFAGTQVFAQSNSVLLKDGLGAPISAYSSITDAYAAIPPVIVQPYVIEIDSSYKGTDEIFPVTFVNKAGASATNTITVTINDNAVDLPLVIEAPTGISDAFVFDNADWMIFDGKSTRAFKGVLIGGGIPLADHHMFSFINGSSNNVIRRTMMINGFQVDDGKAVHFGTTGANPGGNSNNTIEYCLFYPECYNGILSDGTISDPNTNLVIRGNTFNAYGISAIETKQGTGRLTIDSNILNITHGGYDTAYTISLNGLTDSTFFTRNNISMMPTSFKLLRSMYIQAGNPFNYVLLANNMITTADMTYVDNGKIGTATDANPNVAAVEFAGTEAIMTDIYHNTMRIRGQLSNSAITTGILASANLIRTEANTGSRYDVKNNILINDRTGGVGGVRHVALSMNTVGSVSMDYNVYTSSNEQLAQVNGSLVSDLTSYKTVMVPLEVNTDSLEIKFIGGSDMHLAHDMMGNTALAGTPVSKVTADYDGDTYILPYRGADEYLVACAAMTGGQVSAPDSVCEGAVVSIPVFGQTARNGVIYQWQWRPAGSTGAFTDIPAQNKEWAYISITQDMEIRFADSCAGGAVAYSDTATLIMKPLPEVTGISETNTGLIYTFSANTQDATIYNWDFGDFQTGTGANPSHTYLADATYEVRLVVANGCGTDTFKKTLQVATGIADAQGNKQTTIYPNPAKGSFFVNYTGSTGRQVTVEVMDIAGRKVLEARYTNTGAPYKVDMLQQAKGIYFVRVQDGEKTTIQKLRVE